jgi:phage baseplate assembly protein W
VQEKVDVEDDRQTIIPLQDPSSSQITLNFNGIDVPQAGTGSHARITSSQGGPFSIRQGINDELNLQVDLGPLQTATLPPGTSTVDEMAESLDESISGARVFVENNLLTFESETTGFESSVYIKESTGLNTLGLVPKYRQGQLLVPSWGLIKDQTSEDPSSRLIQFAEKLRTVDDLILIDYYTDATRCRRCHNLRVEYDFTQDAAGNVPLLENEDLLLQEVEKIILTIRGSNIFHTWYGTRLVDLIGQKGGLGQATTMAISQEISNTLRRYREVKAQQSKLQRVTDKEFLLRILGLNVRQNELDPTMFQIDMTVQNKANETVNVSRNIVVPGSPFLLEQIPRSKFLPNS